jgi:hypothetical protein
MDWKAAKCSPSPSRLQPQRRFEQLRCAIRHYVSNPRFLDQLVNNFLHSRDLALTPVAFAAVTLPNVANCGADAGQ